MGSNSYLGVTAGEIRRLRREFRQVSGYVLELEDTAPFAADESCLIPFITDRHLSSLSSCQHFPLELA